MRFATTLRALLLLALFVVSGTLLAATSKVTAELLTVSSDGRNITFMDAGKEVKSKVSGSRTKVSIGGAASDRENLKAGMSCEIEYSVGGKNEPAMIACK